MMQLLLKTLLPMQGPPLSLVKARCASSPGFSCPHTESPWNPLPLEPQGITTRLETGLLSLSPSIPVFMKSYHELESMFQVFLISLSLTKLAFLLLSLTKVPDLHKQSCQLCSSQPWPSLHIGPSHPLVTMSHLEIWRS